MLVKSWQLLFAMCVLSITSTALAQERIRFAYRADARPPDQVFAMGFQGPGRLLDIFAHTIGGSCLEADPARASAWVSMSASTHQAVRFAEARVRATGQEGWANGMWLYTIRADHAYLDVSLLMSQLQGLAYDGHQGYAAGFGHAVSSVMARTPIGTAQEIVAQSVRNANIMEARPYWYENGQVVLGPIYFNPRYVPLDTYASIEIPTNVHEIAPPNSDLRRTARARSCSMQCDNARFPSVASASEGSQQCSVWSGWLSPAVMATLY